MNAFTSDLFLRALSAGELRASDMDHQFYQLEADLTYHSDRFGVIVAPKGLLTDFASIPRIAFTYISPEDPVIVYGSVIHDSLYSARGNLGGRTFSRAEADEVLAECMAVCGARWGQKKVVLNAVRLFGGSHWKSP